MGQILPPLKLTAAGNRQISYVQSQPQPRDSSQRPAGFSSSIKFCGESRRAILAALALGIKFSSGVFFFFFTKGGLISV